MTNQLELLLPQQIKEKIEQTPWVYIPLGAIEWHGHHNPVGLDAIKAHKQLLRVAEESGGIVYPPIFTGHFTGNIGCPYTYMIKKETLKDLIKDLLLGLEKDGFKKAVLLNGHYPNAIFVGKEVSEEWEKENHTMEFLSIRENNFKNIDGDHGAKDETSMMLDLAPELVDSEALVIEGETDLEKGDWLKTPLEHPLHGLVGFDPRGNASKKHGEKLNTILVNEINSWIKTGEINLEYIG